MSTVAVEVITEVQLVVAVKLVGRQTEKLVDIVG